MADYAFPWDRVIARFKYHDAPELAALLVDGLLEARQAAATPLGDAFVPVPLSAARLAERGYDQAWELARRLAPALQRPTWPRALQRRFDHPAQATLSRRERLANLRGAFSVPADALAQVQGRHLVLVDDVLTTGATAHEAALTLRRAGAARVDLWVLARTPEPATAH